MDQTPRIEKLYYEPATRSAFTIRQAAAAKNYRHVTLESRRRISYLTYKPAVYNTRMLSNGTVIIDRLPG